MSSSKLKIPVRNDLTLNDYYIIKQKLKALRPLLLELSVLGKDIVPILEEFGINLHRHFRRITKAKIGGAATSIVGGVLATVGFGLSFVTFGASLGLSIAGTIIAGSGGITVASSSLTDVILSKKRKKRAQAAMARYQELLAEVSKECLDIGGRLQSQANSDVWLRFWESLLLGFHGTRLVKYAGWDIVAKTVLNSLRLGGYFADDALSTGAQVTGTVFRSLGTAGKALHITGGVVGIIFMPFDVYTLVSASIDEHKENKNDATLQIENWAREIENSCPKVDEIDAMINGTLEELWQRCNRTPELPIDEGNVEIMIIENHF